MTVLEHALYDLRIGDCLDPTAGLASLADKSVDVTITDPPYSDATHDGARTGGDGEKKLVTFASIDADGLRRAFSEIGRVTRRWVVATVDWQHVLPLKSDPPPGLRFVRFGIWVKPNGSPQFTGDRPGQGWEAVVIMHADVPGAMRWNGGGDRAVWTVPKVNGEHPTQKPIDLLSTWVRLFSDKDELILDPFMGSGTTGVAAIRNGRRFIGWELDPKHHATAQKRIGAAREQLGLFGGAA